MKIIWKNYIRYILEFNIIIVGVLLSFYLDDLRLNREKNEYKDTLVEELLIAAQQDLDQIEKIKVDLNQVNRFIENLLLDIEDGEKDLTDKEIAEKYLFISNNMSTSFFPQNGTFNQLIATGSMELIDSKNFRRALLNNYTHYYERNNALNRSLDDLSLELVSNVDPKILVISGRGDSTTFIYTEAVLKSYEIDQKFYLSNLLRAYLMEISVYQNFYLDMLETFRNSYDNIIAFANDEIN